MHTLRYKTIKSKYCDCLVDVLTIDANEKVSEADTCVCVCVCACVRVCVRACVCAYVHAYACVVHAWVGECVCMCVVLKGIYVSHYLVYPIDGLTIKSYKAKTEMLVRGHV